MELIISSDDLNRLERRFGPNVHRLGSWYSDGVFTYTRLSTADAEKAAAAVNDPALTRAVSEIRHSSDPAQSFLRILETAGSDFLSALLTVCEQPLQTPDCQSEKEGEVIVEWQL